MDFKVKLNWNGERGKIYIFDILLSLLWSWGDQIKICPSSQIKILVVKSNVFKLGLKLQEYRWPSAKGLAKLMYIWSC